MGRELKEKESQTACCTGDLFHTHVKRRTGKVLGQCCPRSAQQPAHALPEGGTHWHDMTQNMRRAKVCCICKTTGILGETCLKCGMPPGTSSLPPWQCPKARKAQVGLPV